MTYRTLVSFDWAIKRLLRNKADYVIVEGLLTVLLDKKITITGLLESESNKESQYDKYNCVDILAKSEEGELLIFEIQYDEEYDYFQRITYGTSKAITEYLKGGDIYGKLCKVYSINIVYFDLGQGNDYVYHGKTEFRSIHDSNDILTLSNEQRKTYKCETPGDIMPEYYILKVNQFDKLAVTPLDEWISFLKTSEIPRTATAPGLPEARERLRIDSLEPAERHIYDMDMTIKRNKKSELETAIAKGLNKGIKRGERKKALAIARSLKALGKMTDEEIADVTGLTVNEIQNLIIKK